MVQHPDATFSSHNHLDYSKWFVAALKQMSSLQSLNIMFYDVEEQSARFFEAAAETVKLPSLQHLSFWYACFQMHDLLLFLRNHAPTLKYCELAPVFAYTDDEKAYRDLLSAFASDDFDLEAVSFGELYGNDGSYFAFPDLDCTEISDEPNEDGYIVVDTSLLLHLEGKDQVRTGLIRMLNCIERVQ